MAQTLSQCKHVLNIPINDTLAWTDSIIVLSGVQGSPRRYKVFVGNRVAQIMEHLNAGDTLSVKTIQQIVLRVECTRLRS